MGRFWKQQDSDANKETVVAQVEWQKCKDEGGIYHTAIHGKYTLYACRAPERPISFWLLYKGKRKRHIDGLCNLMTLRDAKAAAEAALEKHLATE